MAFAVASLFGMLPLFIKAAMNIFSATTVTCARLLVAFIVLYALQQLRKKQPIQQLRTGPGLGILAGLFLAGNYYTYNVGIDYSGPSNAQIMIQTAPVMLVIIGVVFLKEQITKMQLLGMVVASFGFVLFYRDRLNFTADLEQFAVANWLIILSAACWAIFAALQKVLTKTYAVNQVNLVVFASSSLPVLFAVDGGEFAATGPFYIVILLFLGVITMLAYSALGEAFKHLPTATVGAIVTLNPLITLVLMYVVTAAGISWLPTEPVGSLGYLGACVAVFGVVIVVSKGNGSNR